MEAHSREKNIYYPYFTTVLSKFKKEMKLSYLYMIRCTFKIKQSNVIKDNSPQGLPGSSANGKHFIQTQSSRVGCTGHEGKKERKSYYKLSDDLCRSDSSSFPSTPNKQMSSKHILTSETWKTSGKVLALG